MIILILSSEIIIIPWVENRVVVDVSPVLLGVVSVVTAPQLTLSPRGFRDILSVGRLTHSLSPSQTVNINSQQRKTLFNT